jgi:uncharacterized protein (DUF952 family)
MGSIIGMLSLILNAGTAPVEPPQQVSVNQEVVMMQAESPELLYKIISTDQWEASQEDLVLAETDMPFIHLATEEQLPRIIEKFWPDQDCIVLKLDASKLIGRLVLEANPGGNTQYYHLYDGQIPAEAVLDVSLVQH